METEQVFSQKVEQMPENTRMKLNVDKLVLIFQFQFHFQCSLLLEVKNHLLEMLISMEKLELNFILK